MQWSHLPSLMGTTSACAENTTQPSTNGSNIWNYLRVRGEYVFKSSGLSQATELPPRARRIPHPQARSQTLIGTTSACAENTSRGQAPADICWNYLRVRGEYLRTSFRVFCTVELPPRARRIQNVKAQAAADNGTTSACAENTICTAFLVIWIGNYLRVRGEYKKRHLTALG